MRRIVVTVGVAALVLAGCSSGTASDLSPGPESSALAASESASSSVPSGSSSPSASPVTFADVTCQALAEVPPPPGGDADPGSITATADGLKQATAAVKRSPDVAAHPEWAQSVELWAAQAWSTRQALEIWAAAAEDGDPATGTYRKDATKAWNGLTGSCPGPAS